MQRHEVAFWKTTTKSLEFVCLHQRGVYVSMLSGKIMAGRSREGSSKYHVMIKEIRLWYKSEIERYMVLVVWWSSAGFAEVFNSWK